MLFSLRNQLKSRKMSAIRAVERLEDRQLLTGIAVTVLPGTDLASSTVDVSGFERHRITASENSQMGLTAGEWSGTLNDSVAAYLGGAYPKWATVANWSSSCNICGNYATYGWTEVHTTVQPVSAVIVSFDLEQEGVNRLNTINDKIDILLKEIKKG